MQTNLFRDRIVIIEKFTTQTPTGKVVTRKPVETRYGLKIPLDSRAVLEYQQLKSEVTHKLVFNKAVTLNLAVNEFQHGGHVYQPFQPPQHLQGNTVILVKEIS
jgi:hypothetical protein